MDVRELTAREKKEVNERLKTSFIADKDMKAEKKDRVSIEDFCSLLKYNGKTHNHGYYHYTTWGRFAKIMQGKFIEGIGKRKLFALSRADGLNDGSESSKNVFIASFSYGDEEEVAMWTIYGVPHQEAVRLRFPMAAIMTWLRENPIDRVKMYGFKSKDGGVEELKDIHPLVIDLVDVGYYGRNDKKKVAESNSVVYHSARHVLAPDGWANRVSRSAFTKTMFKQRGWAYEHEVRLVVQFAKGVKIPYQKLALDFTDLFDSLKADLKKNVLLGPSVKKSRLKAIKGIRISECDTSVFSGQLHMRTVCDWCHEISDEKFKGCTCRWNATRH